MNRFIELSWKLLEYKLFYYRPDLVAKKYIKQLTISDNVYDSLENEYKWLARTFNMTPSVTDMVGFCIDKPCCRLVYSKYSK